MDPSRALQQEAAWLVKAAEPAVASEYRMRMMSYMPRRGNRFDCPHCWVRHQTPVALTPIPSDTNDHDLLRCDTCRNDFIVPLG